MDLDALFIYIKIALLALAGAVGLFLLLAPESLPRRLRAATLIVLSLAALTAVGTYIRFGSFPGGSALHHHDLAHYYFGAKYAPELGYFNLYRCLVIADAEILKEDGREMSSDFKDFEIRRLDDGRLRRAAEIAADPDDLERCRTAFSSARWTRFKKDVRAYYIVQSHGNLYDRCGDRGYHGTPVWGLYASALANLLPVERPWLLAASLLDPLLILLAFGLCLRAFGAERTLIAFIFYLSVHYNHANYIHGSFLRYDWMAFTLAALATLKLGRFRTSGALFALASLVRLFPVLLLVGLIAKAAFELIATRRIDVRVRRFGVSFVVTAALLMGASLTVFGFDYQAQYAKKIEAHGGVESSTRFGLPYMLKLVDGKTPAAVAGWIGGDTARIGVMKNVGSERKVLSMLALVLGLAALALAARRMEDDEAACLSFAAVFLATGITTYYGVIIAVWALLFTSQSRPKTHAVALIALIAASIHAYTQNLAGVSEGDVNIRNSLLIFGVFALAVTLILAQGTRLARIADALLKHAAAFARARPFAAAAGPIMPALCLAALGIASRFSDPTPGPEDWRRAMDALTTHGFNSRRDAIVIVPEAAREKVTAPPAAVVYFMDDPGRESFPPYDRLFVLSVPGRFAPENFKARPNRVVFQRMDEGSFLDRPVDTALLAFTDSNKPGFRALEHLNEAAVRATIGPETHDCARKEPRRFDCSSEDWNHVGVEKEKFFGRPRELIWAHPVKGELVVEFPAVEFGRWLTVEAGLSDFAVSLDDGAAVVLWVEAGEGEVGAAARKNVPGLMLRTFDTSALQGQTLPLRFRVTTRDPGRRHFLFDAVVYN